MPVSRATASAPAPTAAPAPPAPEPEVEATPPGSPAIVQPTAVTQKWNEMLRALSKYSSSAPGVVQHFRVQRIDGNQLYICTDNDFYFGRLNGQREKLQVIEKALYDVHRARLKVQVVLVTTFDEGGSKQGGIYDDPLLALGAQLGAEIKPKE
jgi:hypothetical protein